MIIEIPGNPIPQARPRLFNKNGHSFVYDSQMREKRNTKRIMSIQLKRKFNSESKIEIMEASELSLGDRFHVTLRFDMPIPLSFNQIKRNRILWGLEEMNSKPDLDNLAKFYLDCANGILIPDDRMIVRLDIEKKYSETPKTVMEIKKMKKKTSSSQADRILSIYSPEDVFSLTKNLDIIRNKYYLFKYSSDIEERDIRLEELTRLLMEFSNEHCDRLKKIKNIGSKIPMEGKTLC